MLESNPIRLQVRQASSVIGHTIQNCHQTLKELRRLSQILFTQTRAEPSDIQAWFQAEGFGIDKDGFWTQLALLDAFRQGTAPENAVSYSWNPALRKDPEAGFRMFCLKDIGRYLAEIREQLPGTAWIYYQDVTNTALQYPYIDQITAITPDFDWSCYHTYVSVAPENNPDKEIRWTSPTIDYAGEGLIISASIPVYLEERFVGLWSMDLPMACLYKDVSFENYLEGQVNFIIDHNGFVVSHPTVELEINREKGSVYRRHLHQLGIQFKSLDPQDLFLKGQGQQLLSNGSGNDVVAWFEAVPGIQWIFFATVPRQSMEDAINMKIRKALDRVKSGDLSYRIQDLSQIDQVRLVAEGFNQMAAALEKQEEIRKEAKAEKAKLEKRLRHFQRMEAIGTLAGGIAHDFNNILFPIIGYAELLFHELPEKSSPYEMVQQIHKAAGRARDLTRQILTFSRQAEVESRPISFQSIVKEVLKLLRSSIPKSIEIMEDIQNDCPPVKGDPTGLHQITMNLCTNAFHAVEGANGKFEVTLKSVNVPVLAGSGFQNLSPGTYVRLTVADNGMGMDAGVLGKIFDPYFTTKAEGKGTGLGLAVTYGIVQKMNGDIKVYSEPEKGTTVHVFLPEAHFFPSNEDVPDPIAPKGVGRVLLVDDEQSIVNLGRQFLSRYGYTVSAFTKSTEALEAFVQNPDAFDIVVTDMTMPKMTGDIFASHVKELRPDIPVILCTGFSEKISNGRKGEGPIDTFLMKPVPIKEVHLAIQALLDRAKPAKAFSDSA